MYFGCGLWLINSTSSVGMAVDEQLAVCWCHSSCVRFSRSFFEVSRVLWVVRPSWGGRAVRWVMRNVVDIGARVQVGKWVPTNYKTIR